jgi:hypothetical protein
VSVGGDGVRTLDARGDDERCARRQRREEPERRVDMQPGTELLGRIRNIGQ